MHSGGFHLRLRIRERGGWGAKEGYFGFCPRIRTKERFPSFSGYRRGWVSVPFPEHGGRGGGFLGGDVTLPSPTPIHLHLREVKCLAPVSSARERIETFTRKNEAAPIATGRAAIRRLSATAALVSWLHSRAHTYSAYVARRTQTGSVEK